MDFQKEMQFTIVENDPYLILENSVKHYKELLQKDRNQIEPTNFDILKVHEKFIIWKYYEFFEKTNNRNIFEQYEEKYKIDLYCRELAIPLIFKLEWPFFNTFKDLTAYFGIIKPQGSSVEFNPITFTDFFAAKYIIQSVKQNLYVIDSSYREIIVKEILRKPSFQLIRTFINLELKNGAKKYSLAKKKFEKNLRYCGMAIDKTLTDYESDLIDEKGTMLHTAILEGNKNIVRCFLDCLKDHSISLKKVLFATNEEDKNVLHLAREKKNDEIVKLLLDAAAGISDDTLQQFLNC